MTPVTVTRGGGPIILGLPHSGVFVPDEIWASLNTLGRQLLDTDWHVPTLYENLIADVTLVRANFSRYVIDANRDPDGASLYPGQNTTALVPTTSFDGAPIWNNPPNDAGIASRLMTFHRPYHDALKAEIDRVKSQHGLAVLYDCHSIRSEIPHLFDERLPDLNVGTNNGEACAPEITHTVEKVCAAASGFTSVLDGRFKGGWTTRHYGRPDENIHAIQMEISQRCYLVREEPPFSYDAVRAVQLQKVLRRILTSLINTIKTDMKTRV